MRRKNRIDYKYFWEFWIKVIEESQAGTFIIAEGKKDERVLRRLLIPGDILLLHNRSISSVIDTVKMRDGRRAIIFTDFDKKGEFLARRLRIAFIREGIQVLDNFRNELKIMFKGLVQIENLNKMVDDLLDHAPFNIYMKAKGKELWQSLL